MHKVETLALFWNSRNTFPILDLYGGYTGNIYTIWVGIYVKLKIESLILETL